MFPTNPQIDEALKLRVSHLQPGSDKVEFVLPSEDHRNRLLFLNLPTGDVDERGHLDPKGKMGVIRHFYIPVEIYKRLSVLYERFDIPEDLRPDLIGAHVNMFFANCTSLYETEFETRFKEDRQELTGILPFLHALKEDKINIKKISIEYQERIQESGDRRSRFSERKKKTVKGTLAVGVIENAMKLFEQAQLFNTLSAFGETEKSPSLKPFMGHKNAQTKAINNYSRNIYTYLSDSLFKHLFQYLDTPEVFDSELKKIRHKYSRRQMFLFIGELMQVSGLSRIKKNAVDDEIIDYIKKQLTPLLRARKERIKQIQERNKNSEDGKVEVIPFNEFF